MTKKFIGNIFDKYPLTFDTENEISIIHGFNGTGKTKSLEMLKDYFEKQGENVIYFPSDRKFNLTKEQVESLEVMWSLADKDFFEMFNIRYDFKIQPWDIEDAYDKRITSGMLNIISFIGTIMLAEKPSVVIIDSIETSLHPIIAKEIVGDLFQHKKVKKLIVTAYRPEVWQKHLDKVHDIKNLVNIRGGH
ncbi:hypothetical protein D3C87_78530 [compost metagenome]